MDISLCENCNSDNGGNGLEVATIRLTDRAGREYGEQRWHHGLCDKCGESLGHLDVAEFVRRHQDRRRTLDLP